ncbi:MAG: DUF1127 domain-containing protein [Pseudomonadota bacterium]
MATITMNTTHIAAPAVNGWIARQVDAYRAWLSYRKTVAALAQLSDRELADIGLTRSEINYVARKTS